MVKIWIDKDLGKIKVLTDSESIIGLFKVTTEEKTYSPWMKKWVMSKVTHKIYDNTRAKIGKSGTVELIFGLGWAAYLVNSLRPYVSELELNQVLSGAVFSENPRLVPFKELRDYQNEDVLHVLKFKVGLFSCYTSYGKTQTIATMANYAYTLGKNVLLVTPGKKAKDELVKRCKTVFGLDIPSSDGRIDCIITSGLLNRNDIKDSGRRKDFESGLAKYEWVLADEVEYTINDSGDYLYSCLTGATNLYGFSGTADKKGAELISFANGLSDVVIRNKGLIKYFGPSLVYRMPQGMKIDDITIKTKALDAVDFDDADFDKDGTNKYLTGITKIWTTPEVCELVVKIIGRFPKLFIPINNLINILNIWISDYWLGKYRILLVCGEGYVYYDLSGNKTILSLTEACEYISSGRVDVIPSTSSGYRALDFPNLENIFLVEGLVAGVVLQSIGRVARGSHMNILTLKSATGKWIPLYSKGDKARKELFRTYYKYCDLTESVVTENDL